MTQGVNNPNAKKRFEPFLYGASRGLVGPLEIDFFKIKKYIVPNTKIVIRLYRQNPEFLLLYDDNKKTNDQPQKKDDTDEKKLKVELAQADAAQQSQKKYFKITIEKAYLYTNKVRVRDNVYDLIQNQLKQAPAQYRFTDTVLVPVIVPPTQTSITRPIWKGQLPERVEMFQLKMEAAGGSLKQDPLYFNHFNLTELSLEVDGKPVAEPYRCNFSKGDCLRLWIDYFRNLGCNQYHAAVSLIDPTAYANGYAIFNFNLTNLDECHPDIMTANKAGTLTLHAAYNPVVKRDYAFYLFCLLRFNRTMFIHGDGHVNVE